MNRALAQLCYLAANFLSWLSSLLWNQFVFDRGTSYSKTVRRRVGQWVGSLDRATDRLDEFGMRLECST